MRSIYGKILFPLALLLVLGVVTSASASAAEWHLNGKVLTGSEKLSETVKVEESIVLSVPSLPAAVECTGLIAAISK